MSNEIPALDCHLGPDTYADQLDKNTYIYPMIVNLIDNDFLYNSILNTSVVLIRAQQEGLVPI